MTSIVCRSHFNFVFIKFQCELFEIAYKCFQERLCECCANAVEKRLSQCTDDDEATRLNEACRSMDDSFGDSVGESFGASTEESSSYSIEVLNPDSADDFDEGFVVEFLDNAFIESSSGKVNTLPFMWILLVAAIVALIFA